jgi:alkylation response protein AidB-like acyl-CoA dehydrogenase
VLHGARTVRRLGADYLFDVVVFEEMARSGFTGPGFMIHCDLVATYIASFGSEAQKKRWLPKMVTGEAIGSLGMTEPHAGSDLKAIRTKAVRDGDDYVISGQKVFISNGQLCDVIVLATKTDSSAGAKGVTLFLVDTSLPGFRRGKNLHKLGMKAQDTSELLLRRGARSGRRDARRGRQGLRADDDQARPGAPGAGDPLGRGGRDGDRLDHRLHRQPQGLRQDDRRLPEHAVQARRAEDRGVVGRQFTDKCIASLHERASSTRSTRRWPRCGCRNMHCKVVDECLQLFGGWGYMWEYPIARAYADARIVKIAGGSIEVMKHIIGRQMFSKYQKEDRYNGVAGINPA